MTNQKEMVSLGGHTHDVCCISIQPVNEDHFVTCSMDFTLKVWDLHAVVSGQVPAKEGGHYVILEGSPDGTHYATCQGWESYCRLFRVKDDQKVGESEMTGNMMECAAFNKTATAFISIDTGHGGQYDVSHFELLHAV